MSTITLSEPDGPYSASIETGAMDVEVRGAYLGIRVVADGGATLSVSLRDNGFELVHKVPGADGRVVTLPVQPERES